MRHSALTCALRALAMMGTAVGASQARAADLYTPKGYDDAAHGATSQQMTAMTILDGEPGTITVAGITVYGTIDLGGAYLSHGTPQTGSFYQGNEYVISKNSNRAQTNFTNNAESQSVMGVKGTQSLSDLTGMAGLEGWSAIFDLQMGFDPAFGEISDVLQSERLNNGVPLALQSANADGSRAGQIFNGEAWGGLKHNMLGELRYGRQNSLLLDAFSQYDPQKLSYAYSLLGYSGTFGGGFGDTEDVRWNNSLKYKNTIGPVRIGGHYRFGGYGQGGDFYSAGLGVDVPGAFKGLAIDGVWGRTHDAISASPLSAGDCAVLAPLGGCTQLDVLNGTVSDNETYSIMAKYQIGQFTGFGGWEHIRYSNPSDQLDSLTIIGDYTLNAANVNYNAYTTDKILDVTWLGARFAFTPKLTGAAAWYHVEQNSFVAKDKPCTTAGQAPASIQGNCAGSEDVVSVSLDYQWTKRLDVYAGVMYSQVHDGMAAGFLNTDNVSPTAGARFRF